MIAHFNSTEATPVTISVSGKAVTVPAWTFFFARGMLDSFELTTLVSPLAGRYGISIAGVDIVPENFRSAEAVAQLLATCGVENESCTCLSRSWA